MKIKFFAFIIALFASLSLIGFIHAGGQQPELRPPEVTTPRSQLPNDPSNLINIKANKSYIQIEADYTVIEIKGSNNTISINNQNANQKVHCHITYEQLERVKKALLTSIKLNNELLNHCKYYDDFNCNLALGQMK